MPPATFDETTVDITAGGLHLPREGHGAEVRRLDGDLRPDARRDGAEGGGPGGPSGTTRPRMTTRVSGVLPPLAEGDRLELKALRPEQKFTQPPPRFSEATLVKELEENGIGRPSTYASIIGVLQDREYVNKIEGRFKPSALGVIIADLLTKSFDDIIDVEYTRSLEEDLDKIEQGKTDYVKTLTAFYKKFKKDLARAGKEMIDLKKGIEIGEACDKCGAPMLKRVGKFGPFIACSALSGVHEHARGRDAGARVRVRRGRDRAVRELRQADGHQARPVRPVPRLHGLSGVQDDAEADRHQAGRARRGQARSDPRRAVPDAATRTWSSSRAASASSPRAPAIPSASTSSTRRQASSARRTPTRAARSSSGNRSAARSFFGCSNYPDCDFVLWNRPIVETCPKCGAPYLVEKITKKLGRQLLCNNEDCDYARSEELPESAA